jgi:hypothetical protein
VSHDSVERTVKGSRFSGKEKPSLFSFVGTDMGLLDKWNKEGIPAPMIRDPKIGLGSITASLVVASAGLCALCIILVALSGVAKVSGLFLNFADAQQSLINAFNIAFQFFLACGGFYLGRKVMRDPKGQLDLGGGDDSKKSGEVDGQQ